LPNGVQTTPGFGQPLAGSPIAPRSVASAAGAVVTIDCDYAAQNDSVRTRPPVVRNIHIAELTVRSPAANPDAPSCYQAVMVLGPVGYDYNGAVPLASVSAVEQVHLRDCDFGTPALADRPVYAYNVQDLRLENVKIAGVAFNTVIQR